MSGPAAYLEVTSGCLRVFNEGAFGGPFDFACTIAGDEGTAIIKGLRMDGTLSTAHRRAIFAALAAAGFHTAVWHRHRQDGRRVTVRAATGLPPADNVWGTA